MLTLDLVQIITVGAGLVVITKGVFSAWHYLKERWHDPPR